MKLVTRMWLMFLVGFLALSTLCAVGYYGFTSLEKESKLVEDREAAGALAFQKTEISLANVQRAARNILMLHESDDKFAGYVTRIADGRHKVNDAFAAAAATMYSEKGKQLSASIEQKLGEFYRHTDSLLAQAIEVRKLSKQDPEGKLTEQTQLLYSQSDKQQKTFRELDGLIIEASELKMQRLQESSERVKALSGWLTQFFAIVWLVSVAIFLIVVWLSVKTIKQAMTRFSMGIASLVRGDFDHQFQQQGGDEFSQMGGQLNQLATSLSVGLQEVNRVVAALAQGNLHVRVSGDYAGSLDQLKQSVNGSAEAIQKIMQQLSSLAAELEQGHLSASVSKEAPGLYGEVLANLSDSMASMSLVLSEINQIMQRLSDGKLDARVNANAQGDLLQMKQAVNGTLDTLELLVDELVRMAKAQMEGDLTVVSQGTYKGRFKEIQDMGAASTARIAEVVAQALQASHVVSDAASQVSQGSSDLSSRVQEQAAALEQTSATMHQMTSAVQANTENASKVAELAHQVQSQSNDGVQVMQQTIEAMKSIQQASSKIADIVSIIDGIAFQTNLLALNAAVEAARAGEHGRGFAVVASEVRALAGKSADAAKDIKGLIEDSVQRINAGTKLADKSGEMLSTISESVKEVASMIEAISTASKEQATGISQVHLAIANIDRVTQENAALVEETTAAAASLNHEANELRQNITFFKIGQASQSTVRKVMPSAPAVKAEPRLASAKGLPAPKANNGSDEWNEF